VRSETVDKDDLFFYALLGLLEVFMRLSELRLERRHFVPL
jgi:hypothetical protein